MIELKMPLIRATALTAIGALVVGSASLAAAEHQDSGSQPSAGHSSTQPMTTGQSQTGSQAPSGHQETGQQMSQSSSSGSSSSGSNNPEKGLPDAFKASTWIGKQVSNPAGDSLGTVKDLVMDDTGRVQYAIMKTDLHGSKGSKDLVAVPIGHFRYPSDPTSDLVLNVPTDKMRSAPGFDASNWPNMGEPDWTNVVVTYWVPVDVMTEGKTGAAHQGSSSGQNSGKTAAASQGSQSGKSGQVASNQETTYLPKDKERLFEKLDTNNDSAIEPDEAKADPRLSRNFDRIDAYGNDRITRSEFAAFETGSGEGSSGQQGSGQSGQ